MSELIFGTDVSPVTDTDPLAAAQHAERLGYDFISSSDHPHGSHPTYDTPTMLTWIAAHTSRITVASRVLGVPFRRPAVMAKAAASLDLLSGGRFVLGLGAGYLDPEIRALGGPVPSARDKVDGLADAIHIIRGAWTTSRFSHQGRIYGAHELEMEPKPARAIPIWLGTFGPRALAVTGRSADGWIPSLGHAPPSQIPAMRKHIDAAAESAGRSPDAIRGIYNVAVRIDPDAQPQPDIITGPVNDVLDQLRRFIDLGFTGLNFIPVGSDRADQLERLAGDVMPILRTS